MYNLKDFLKIIVHEVWVGVIVHDQGLNWLTPELSLADGYGAPEMNGFSYPPIFGDVFQWGNIPTLKRREPVYQPESQTSRSR